MNEIDCDCGGTGVVERDGMLTECVCSILKRICMSMPPFIRKANVTEAHLESPLIRSPHLSFFITSEWADMKAIIKATMIANASLLIKITSDREIRDVFVGSKSRAARGDDEVVFNNIEDLMSAPDLSIVRLNELTYKNKAAPGALEEALSYRMDRERPVWILSNNSRPFGMESHSYSDSVWDLISSLDSVHIPRIHNVRPNPMAASAGPLSMESINLQTVSSSRGKVSRSKPKSASNPKPPNDDPLPDVADDGDGLGSIYASGVPAKKRGFGRRDD